MAGTGFPPDTRLTYRIAETWLLVLLLAFGYATLLGLLVQWLAGWPWWLALFAPLVGGALVYAIEGGTVLPRRLPTADPDPVADQRLFAAVDRLCALAAMDRPKLKVIDVAWPNAIALRLPGRKPTIAVTRGLLDRSDDERLDAVLAHELAHIAHRDAAAMTVALALSTSLALAPMAVLAPVMALEVPLCRAARWCGRLWKPATEDDDFPMQPARPGVPVVLAAVVVPLLVLARTVAFLLLLGLGLVLLPPMLILALPAAGIIARLGRYRELAADRGAAELTGQPAALAAALTALEAGGPAIPAKDLRELRTMASMTIVALPKDAKDAGTDAFSRLLDRMMASHPPLAARLEPLAELSRELGR
ncbi:M48 family metalloprotease [Jiangella muralis]|uniref:M48 family metalloprotease n=1 Tax=Jiangella muralis TaxID=702383 RepID=UPI00069F6DC4|nr:M48 family metalloprotease [Jiangella muralis]